MLCGLGGWLSELIGPVLRFGGIRTELCPCLTLASFRAHLPCLNPAGSSKPRDCQMFLAQSISVSLLSHSRPLLSGMVSAASQSNSMKASSAYPPGRTRGNRKSRWETTHRANAQSISPAPAAVWVQVVEIGDVSAIREWSDCVSPGQ